MVNLDGLLVVLMALGLAALSFLFTIICLSILFYQSSKQTKSPIQYKLCASIIGGIVCCFLCLIIAYEIRNHQHCQYIASGLATILRRRIYCHDLERWMVQRFFIWMPLTIGISGWVGYSCRKLCKC